MTQKKLSGAAASATTPSTHSIYGTADITTPYNFDNDGYPARLAWPNDLAGAIAFRRRVTRLPKQADTTIAFVKAQREHYIHTMVQAVYSTDTAKDNPNFGGVAWFTLGGEHAVPPHEVEALCRVLFQAIIDRGEGGYRGLERADRLSKKLPAKVDFDCNCKTRIENAIVALREWKSICKDIIMSDSRIEDFANAPASAAKDKKTYRENNGTKKETIQKDRAFGVTAVHGAEAAEKLKAQGDLPPTARLGQHTKRRGRKNNKGTKQSAMSPQTQPQPQSQLSWSSSQPRDSESVGQTLLANMSESHLRDFDLLSQDLFGNAYPTDDASGLPQGPPAYELPDFGGTQQGQTFVPQQDRPSVPQPSQRFVPQQKQVLPSASPTYNSYGLGAPQQAPQSFSGYGHGQGLIPVNYSNHINLHGPYSFSNWNNPYGNFTSPMGSHGYGSGLNPSTPAAYVNDTENGSRHTASAATVPPQPTRPLNSAAKQFKHARTATMDAQYQPEPTRVKRDQA